MVDVLLTSNKSVILTETELTSNFSVRVIQWYIKPTRVLGTTTFSSKIKIKRLFKKKHASALDLSYCLFFFYLLKKNYAALHEKSSKTSAGQILDIVPSLLHYN